MGIIPPWLSFSVAGLIKFQQTANFRNPSVIAIVEVWNSVENLLQEGD